MVIIEGPRNVGKTFLLSKTGLDDKIYKFSVSQFFDLFGLQAEEKMVGFSLGKDFQIMKLNKEGLIRPRTIMDRGFLSSVVYGVINNRFTKQFGDFYVKYIVDNFLSDDVLIVYIDAGCEGNPNRCKDRWDNKIEFENQIEIYKRYLPMIPRGNLTVFRNNFTPKSIEEFKELIEEAIK